MGGGRVPSALFLAQVAPLCWAAGCCDAPAREGLWTSPGNTALKEPEGRVLKL